MSDDTTTAILAAVESGSMTASVAADLIGKIGASANAEPAPEQQQAEQPPKHPDEIAAEQFLAEVQSKQQGSWISVPLMGD